MGNKHSGTRRPLIDRLMSYIDIDDTGCWLWTASVTPAGYGRLNIDGRIEAAHRVMWVIWNDAAIPSDRELDHMCRVRRCVNPAHLDLVTHGENVRRGHAVRLTGCDHPRSDRVVVAGRGVVGCRACMRVKRFSKQCNWCGDEYEGTEQRKYCSAACREARNVRAGVSARRSRSRQDI